MAKSTAPREPHRSFTVRVPLSMYIEMSDIAHDEGVHLNQKVAQLLRLGLGHAVNLNDQLLRLVQKSMIEESSSVG